MALVYTCPCTVENKLETDRSMPGCRGDVALQLTSRCFQALSGSPKEWLRQSSKSATGATGPCGEVSELPACSSSLPWLVLPQLQHNKQLAAYEEAPAGWLAHSIGTPAADNVRVDILV